MSSANVRSLLCDGPEAMEGLGKVPVTGGAAELRFRAGDEITGKYRMDRELGRGGMGAVYAATHLQMQVPRAIKVMLTSPRGASEDTLERFVREARAAGRLKSEHAARVYDIDELPEGGLFIVMEYIEGAPLDKRLAEAGPLPWPRAALYIAQACEAIEEAHKAGIVHRDLKPGNLMLAKDAKERDCVKVLDFGIAKLKEPVASAADVPLTNTVTLLGTPLYMSPEQWKSPRDIDARTDIWSLGVILYELLTGQVPFKGSTFGELCAAIQRDPPTPPSVFRSDIPPALERVVLRCLEKRPADRFESAASLAGALIPFTDVVFDTPATAPSEPLQSDARPVVVGDAAARALAHADTSPAAPRGSPSEIQRALAPTEPRPSPPDSATPAERSAASRAWRRSGIALGAAIALSGVIALLFLRHVQETKTEPAASSGAAPIPSATVAGSVVSAEPPPAPLGSTAPASPLTESAPSSGAAVKPGSGKAPGRERGGPGAGVTAKPAAVEAAPSEMGAGVQRTVLGAGAAGMPAHSQPAPTPSVPIPPVKDE